MRAVTCTQDSVTASLALVEGSVISVRRTSGVIPGSSVSPATATPLEWTQQSHSVTLNLENATVWRVNLKCEKIFREAFKKNHFFNIFLIFSKTFFL